MSKYYRISLADRDLATRLGLRMRRCDTFDGVQVAMDEMFRRAHKALGCPIVSDVRVLIDYQRVPESGPTAAQWERYGTYDWRCFHRGDENHHA